MDIDLIRSLTSNNFLAFFEGDMSLDYQQRAITWYKDHQVSGITIGWNVAIDRNTGELAPFADALQDRSRKWSTFSVAEVEGFAKLCSDNGLTVTLKPYFVDSATTHNISGYDTEWAISNVEAIKATMAKYLLQTADMAQRTQADAIVIGTENSNLSTGWQPQHIPWWNATIASIRAHYSGLLGYSEVFWPHFPSASRDVDNVSFVDKLDFIGANLYTPITAGTNPTYEEAVAGWTNNLKVWWKNGTEPGSPSSLNLLTVLQDISTRLGKPLVLTETGYTASDGAGADPFRLAAPSDVKEQALLLKAEFDVLGTLANWFGGFLLFSDDAYQYGPNYAKANAALTTDYTYGVVGRDATDVLSNFVINYQHPLLGGTGNDKLTDVAGDNVINGGAGFDTLVINGKRADFTLIPEFGRYELKAGNGDVNIIKGVERLVFSDSKIAYDMSGAAGNAALLIGAILGTNALKIPAYTGIAINLLDNGMTLSQLAELGLGTSQFLQAAGSRSNIDVVKELYENVMGVVAPPSAVTQYAGMLDSHILTQAELAVVAAQSHFNVTHIDLVGLATIGLVYV